jgi:ADP-ribose pyrophosphatase YjhB (NUDIX family)
MKGVRVDLVVIGVRERRAEGLLVRLPGSVWALPGTTVPAGTTLEEAARDALAEQTGVAGVTLEQLYTSTATRGRGWRSPGSGWWPRGATP